MSKFKHGSAVLAAATLLAITSSLLLAAPLQSAFSQTTSSTTTLFNPQPGYSQAREDPSFAVHIPFTDLGFSPFLPTTISIPTGMTVIWFNEDESEHSVTVDAGSPGVPQGAEFDSDMIAPGGFFTHTFTVPGTYEYHDSANPQSKGRINVGSGFEGGSNMDMLIGGNALPFNSSKLARVTLSFVPHESAAVIPPDLSITYNVTISNSTSAMYSNQFEDSDGILDLELVPAISRTNSTANFVTWGPDLTDNEGVASDGTYHVQGPVLVNDEEYSIQVSIVAENESDLSSPVSDTFVLPPVGAQ
jgi:plastocyanin